jgi:hypothetical protein
MVDITNNYASLDNWIKELSDCKQLSEADIKKLCDMVLYPTNFNLFSYSSLFFP